MDRTQIEFNIIMRFITKYHNGNVESNKKQFLEEIDSNIKANAISTLNFLNQENIDSIHRFVIENNEMDINDLKKGVIDLYRK